MAERSEATKIYTDSGELRKSNQVKGLTLWNSIKCGFVLKNCVRAEDRKLFKLCNDLRNGRSMEYVLKTLEERRISHSRVRRELRKATDVTILTATNASLHSMNEGFIKQVIKSGKQVRALRALDRKSGKDLDHPVKASFQDSKRLPPLLHSYVGQPVMIVKNRASGENVLNGSRGHVDEFIQHPNTDYIETIRVRLDDKTLVDIKRTKESCWQRLCKNYIERWQRSQFPVVPAYGMTIHKCQGLTLKTVALNLDDIHRVPGNTFFLLYVAITRLKSLEDLFITSEIPQNLASVKPPTQLEQVWDHLLKLSVKTKRDCKAFWKGINKL